MSEKWEQFKAWYRKNLNRNRGLTVVLTLILIFFVLSLFS